MEKKRGGQTIERRKQAPAREIKPRGHLEVDLKYCQLNRNRAGAQEVRIDPNWSNYVNMFPLSFVCPSLTLYVCKQEARSF